MDYVYEFQKEQEKKLEELNKMIEVITEEVEKDPQNEAVRNLGMVGFLATLASFAYRGK